MAKECNKRAFTLIELILSMSVIGLLAGLSLPVFTSLQNRSNVDDAISATVSSLRRARQLSLASYMDSEWSVKIESGQLTLFKGTDFAARDQQFDESLVIVDSVAVAGLSEVTFAKNDGVPLASGTITFSIQNNQKTIAINPKGVIDY